MASTWEEYEHGGASDRMLLDPSLYATYNQDNLSETESLQTPPNIFRLYQPITFPNERGGNKEFLQFKFIRRFPTTNQHHHCIPSQIGLKQFTIEQRLLKPM